jgi:hypothetical protein
MNLSVPDGRGTTDQTRARYSIAKNAVLSSIGTVEVFPVKVQILYDSLLDFVDDAGSFLGLESVRLSFA